MLACERKLQGFYLSHKKFVIPQIHSVSHGFSPTKLKTCVVWVRKDLLRWMLFTCPWFNSFNYLRTCLFFVFGCFVFLGCFDNSKKKKKNSKNIENFQKDKIFILDLVLFFLRITWIIISLLLFTCPWFNSFNYLSTCLLLLFFWLFWLLKKKIQKHWKFSKRQKYFILDLVLFFLRITWIIISLFWLRTCLILRRNTENMCCMTKSWAIFIFVWVCTSLYMYSWINWEIDISCLHTSIV